MAILAEEEPGGLLGHGLPSEGQVTGLKPDLQDGVVEKIILLWAECILDQEVSG